MDVSEENYVQSAIPVWKMFHKTITTVYRDLDNAVNDIENIISTFLTTENGFTDIFVPRIDAFMNNSSALEETELQYVSFTLWFQGRLFYLLGCDKLKCIHELAAKFQLKIISSLKTHHHFYEKICWEYLSVYETIVDFHIQLYESDSCKEVTLKSFLNHEVIISDEINLTPKHLTLNRENVNLLIPNINMIIRNILLKEIDISLRNSLVKKTFEIHFKILQKSTLMFKIETIESCTEIIIERMFPEIESFATSTICVSYFQYLMHVLVHANPCGSIENTSKLNMVVSYLVKALVKNFKQLNYEIVIEICALVKFVIENPNYTNECKKECSSFLKRCFVYDEFDYTLVENWVNSQVITSFSHCNTNLGDLFEIYLKNELNLAIKNGADQTIFLYESSESWNQIQTNLSSYSNLKQIDFLRKLIFQIRIVHIDFRTIKKANKKFYVLFIKNDILSELNKNLFEMFLKLNFETNKNEIECISEIVFHILMLDNFQVCTNQFEREIETMFGFLSFPYLNEISWKLSTPPGVSQTKHRKFESNVKAKHLRMLTLALLHYVSSVKMLNVREWVKQLIKFYAKVNEEELQIEIIKSATLLLISNVVAIQYLTADCLLPALQTNKPKIWKCLASELRKMICILRSDCFVSNEYTTNPIQFQFNIVCENCFRLKFDQHFDEMQRFFNSMRLKQIPKVDCNFLASILIPFIKMIECESNPEVVEEMIDVIVALSVHAPSAVTCDVVRKWLTCMDHENTSIRRKFSETFLTILKNIMTSENVSESVKEAIFSQCQNELIQVANKSLSVKKSPLQDSTSLLVREFGRINLRTSPLVALELLIDFALNCNSSVNELARIYITDLSDSLQINTEQLYLQYKKNVCRSIVDNCVFNYAMHKILFITDEVSDLVLKFGYQSLNDFIAEEGRYMLPFLVVWIVEYPFVNALLENMADLALLTSRDFVINQFGNIYPHLFLRESKLTFDKCMALIQNITKMDESALKRRNFRVIHNELLLYYHENPDRVIEGLKLLFKEDDALKNKSINNRAELVTILQPRFLGLLVHFDSKLISRRVPISVKQQALKSLPDVIKLMGTAQITPLRFKVMATLRTTLTLDSHEFQELSCNAWNTFIRNCDIQALGSILSTIFISLLPMLSTFPKKIDEIFTFLLIENENKLQDHISDLFFLTDTSVSDKLKQIVSRHMEKNFPDTFREQLRFYLKYLNSKTIEVRIYAVNFVTKILGSNRDNLNDLILGNDGIDSVIVELLDLLMTGFRENDATLKLACSCCIGELGAIEPSHLPRRYTKLNESFIFNIQEDNFVVKALTELIRAFQTEKYSQNMDCFALAIQEILKLYNISPTSSSTECQNLWNNFPENQRQIMQPLLSSRYKIAFHSEQIDAHPIFQVTNINFNDWIHGWVGKIISFINNETTRNFFEFCRPSLRKDMQLLMFFMPYIIFHALADSTNNSRNLLYEEMLAVLTTKKNNWSDYFEFKPLKADLLRYVPSLPTTEEIMLMKSTKVIYSIFDFLTRWLREWVYQNCPTVQPETNDQYCTIKAFLDKFSKLMIARSNYKCEEYSRALIYLEDFVDQYPGQLKKQFGFLTRIYVQLDDPDGVAGVRAIQQAEPSLEEMILAHEISGQLQDAAACYERLAQQKDHLEPYLLQGLIRCYLDLDNPFTAAQIIDGLEKKQPNYSSVLHESEAETLWRLNQYDKLSQLLNKPELKKNTSWGVRLGYIFSNFRNDERQLFCEELAFTRRGLVNYLSTCNQEEGTYEYSYPQIMKLHILNELQKGEVVVHRLMDSNIEKDTAKNIVNQMITEWDKRERLVQSNVRVLEPLYSLRRIALQQAEELLSMHRPEISDIFSNHIGHYWIKSAQVARLAGLHQQAYIYLLNAERYKPSALFVERAKLHYARGEQELAFTILKRGIDENFKDFPNTNEGSSSTSNVSFNSQRVICAEAKLLVASYNEETANLDAEANIAKYKEAIDCNKQCEKSMVYLARYYDKALMTLSNDKDIDLGGDMQLHIINYFAKSLQYGCQYIYQSMPRMLSIWVDYGSRQLEVKIKDRNYEAKSLNIHKMTKLISTSFQRLPPYMFLSAFSQIVSRICHPHKQVYQQLKTIIIKLIISYPQQTLWMLMSVFKSSYTLRVKRCQEILQDERLKATPQLFTLIHDFHRLAQKLIELCNKGISKGISTITVSALVNSLPKMIASKEFSQIMMPVQQFLKMVLPSDSLNLSNHNPFPRKLVYITRIEENVTVMPSLQRPRRIIFLGSNGVQYMHMLKPKDDLRKDFRLMEFNDVVNKYLHLEAETRQRRLFIRTYSVVPLNEECGIIEWIHNLVAFRSILMKIYKQKGLYVSPKDVRGLICNLYDPLPKKREVFEKTLLPKHPAVFHEWFRYIFPDPHAWYQARTSYIRTTAVMSIVGYILGLGDRHGENILFDSTNGDTVHVDFNCLFNRGESLEWPERVPFRLTHNMVKAMGPLGVEGTFRRSCEITLRVLRAQKDTLMSIVKPFVYDPLVSWPRDNVANIDTNAERTNEQAKDHVRNIESRLLGMKGGGKLPIPLSVEGHVNSLILDATNVDNLCQMYVGWGGFL